MIATASLNMATLLNSSGKRNDSERRFLVVPFYRFVPEHLAVILAKAGIQSDRYGALAALGPRLRGGDRNGAEQRGA